MDAELFAAQVSDLLGAETVSMSVTPRARAVIDRLGAAWVASALRPLLLLRGADQTLSAELHVCDRQPMTYVAQTRGASHEGVVLVGDGQDVSAGHLTLPGLDILDGSAPFAIGPQDSTWMRLASGAYGRLYRHLPLGLDTYRQWCNHRRRLDLRAGSWSSATTGAGLGTGRRTMWVAMHWAEEGGAESWAWTQARLAAQAGFNLVITTDRAAPQRLLDQALSLTPYVYSAGNAVPVSEFPRLAMALMDRHQVTDIHIHHSLLAYRALPLVRALYPGTRVEDSTHVVEYRGGGFAGMSVAADGMIDLHHVISPQLLRLYRQAGVPRHKVVYRPLTQVGAPGRARARRPVAGAPVRVGFLGRFSVQKRPYLFQRVAAVLSRGLPGRFAFIMQGAGELEGTILKDSRRLRLGDTIEYRRWGPAEDLLQDVDVLLVPSENEGLTLTALEADAMGVLVVSADVGSQDSVVAQEALLPAQPVAFMAEAVRLLNRLARHPSLRARLLAEQHRKVGEVERAESASSFFSHHYQKLVSP